MNTMLLIISAIIICSNFIFLLLGMKIGQRYNWKPEPLEPIDLDDEEFLKEKKSKKIKPLQNIKIEDEYYFNTTDEKEAKKEARE